MADLYISHNPSLSYLSIHAFNGILYSGLRNLHLMENTALVLQPGIFEPLQNLKILHLTGSLNMSSIPNGTFSRWLTLLVRLPRDSLTSTTILQRGVRIESKNEMKTARSTRDSETKKRRETDFQKDRGKTVIAIERLLTIGSLPNVEPCCTDWSFWKYSG